MTQEEFYSSLAQPTRLSLNVVDNLEQELVEYPYFEAGWMLMLKAMNDLGVTNFDTSLHRGAVSISNRKALFNLIHSKVETSAVEVAPAEPEKVEVVVANKEKPTAKTISWEIGDYEYNIDTRSTSSVGNAPYSIDNITKTISDGDNCAFTDWLDYMDKKPSVGAAQVKTETPTKSDRRKNTRSRSLDLIESFLNSENAEVITPKATPVKREVVESKLREEQPMGDNDDILTETLAKIYIKQQQYDKAIDIFRKLGLKYPEKSSYFASRINELENK
ncbi:MAG: tetratricopeptide repeat protein [Bacteroidia bacterium]|nr:tetratricopeptide repeat protein [Bacteroidia bacterium]